MCVAHEKKGEKNQKHSWISLKRVFPHEFASLECHTWMITKH